MSKESNFFSGILNTLKSINQKQSQTQQNFELAPPPPPPPSPPADNHFVPPPPSAPINNQPVVQAFPSHFPNTASNAQFPPLPQGIPAVRNLQTMPPVPPEAFKNTISRPPVPQPEIKDPRQQAAAKVQPDNREPEMCAEDLEEFINHLPQF